MCMFIGLSVAEICVLANGAERLAANEGQQRRTSPLRHGPCGASTVNHASPSVCVPLMCMCLSGSASPILVCGVYCSIELKRNACGSRLDRHALLSELISGLEEMEVMCSTWPFSFTLICFFFSIPSKQKHLTIQKYISYI